MPAAVHRINTLVRGYNYIYAIRHIARARCVLPPAPPLRLSPACARMRCVLWCCMPAPLLDEAHVSLSDVSQQDEPHWPSCTPSAALASQSDQPPGKQSSSCTPSTALAGDQPSDKQTRKSHASRKQAESLKAVASVIARPLTKVGTFTAVQTKAATSVQSAWRGFHTRTNFMKQKLSSVMIARKFRAQHARREFLRAQLDCCNMRSVTLCDCDLLHSGNLESLCGLEPAAQAALRELCTGGPDTEIVEAIEAEVRTCCREAERLMEVSASRAHGRSSAELIRRASDRLNARANVENLEYILRGRRAADVSQSTRLPSQVVESFVKGSYHGGPLNPED